MLRFWTLEHGGHRRIFVSFSYIFYFGNRYATNLSSLFVMYFFIPQYFFLLENIFFTFLELPIKLLVILRIFANTLLFFEIFLNFKTGVQKNAQNILFFDA